jgi:SAM-dependent methyltransferase
MTDEVSIQRDYYRRTAHQYDQMHVAAEGEHEFALAFMLSMIEFYKIQSVLDIGSGTGRALLQIKSTFPWIRVVGIEPSPELRALGHAKGIGTEELIDGDAQALGYGDGAFDLVCEFGALHHIPKPRLAVSEMLRGASKAIFISDCNNFGQGSLLGRAIKQSLKTFGIWNMADYVKTRGRGYTISDGDGLAYSYSVFSDYPQIVRSCRSVHLLNTVPAGANLYRSASLVALLGLK